MTRPSSLPPSALETSPVGQYSNSEHRRGEGGREDEDKVEGQGGIGLHGSNEGGGAFRTFAFPKMHMHFEGVD